MSALTILLLGFGLGLRHATDADHLVIITALLQREPGVLRAARIAALWGAGHTAAFLGVGFLVVLAGLRVPARFEHGAEALVGLMLIGFGLWHALSRRPRTTHSERSAYARPVAVGVVHGLAGSAAIALLAATAIESRLWAVVYLGLFSAGTVIGMVALTVAVARPIAWTLRRTDPVRRAVTVASALLSVGLGAWLLAAAIGAP